MVSKVFGAIITGSNLLTATSINLIDVEERDQREQPYRDRQ